MRRSLMAALSLAWLAVSATPGHAQYKWQTADGGIVYSDLPPPQDARPMQDRAGRRITAAAEDGDATLPFAVQSAKTKFPVTLYTAADCPPCQSARDLLTQRGIPFSEKRIGSAADVTAYKALGFADAALPGIGVGRERSAGFEPGSWHTLLDAAGYPKQSMLPAKYRQGDPTPLVTPPAQKVEVIVREEPADATGSRPPVRAADPVAAIERYRQAMQEAVEAERRAHRPDVRF